MAIPDTEAEQRDQFARDTREKIKLEEQLKPKLVTFFRNIARDNDAIFKVTGNFVNTGNYTTDLIAILREHYRKVIKKFSGGLTEGIEKQLQATIETKQLDDDLNVLSALYIANHSEQQAALMADTNKTEIEEAAITALILLAAAKGVALTRPRAAMTVQDLKIGASTTVSGINITRDELASKQRMVFIQRGRERSSVIAMSETNNAAEFTKATEARLLAGSGAIINGQSVQNKILKIWNTILDNRTRPAHVEADQQIRPIDEPFNVGGERLMFPTDTSLGATAGNVINCRCAVTNRIAE